MKLIKKILLVILSIVVLALIVAAFTKKEYSVSREIVINKPKQEVFSYVKLLKNQDNYSKWATMDVNMKKEFRGTDGTVGFVSAWDSQKDEVGKGEQTIKKITEGESVELGLHFIKPFEGLADVTLSTTDAGNNQTKVVWSLKSKMNYPMNLMLLFMDMEKMIGDDLAVGLTNLKQLQEK